MLRQIYLILNDEIIYQYNYAKGLDNSSFLSIYPNIKEVAFSKFGVEFGTNEFFEYKLSYIVEKSLKLICLFVTGLKDTFESIEPQLIYLQKEFLNFFSENLIGTSTLINAVTSIGDIIHGNLKPKISLIGFSGVGKTTINNLMKSEEFPMQNTPTKTGEIATVKIGALKFFLWDFTDQDDSEDFWEEFIKDSDVVLLLLDSSLGNLDKSKKLLIIASKAAPYARLAVIANKQDLSVAMSTEGIERVMGQKAYPFVALDQKYRVKMIRIIADILDMDPQVSPLLKPLFERDELINKAENALEQGEYKGAINFFENVQIFCLEIGDDSQAHEFQTKVEKLRKAFNIQ